MRSIVRAVLGARPFPPGWGVLTDPAVVAALGILCALLIDAAVGDPQFRFHPVRLIGGVASWSERLTRRLLGDRSAGIVSWFVVVIVTAAIGAVLLWGADSLGDAGRGESLEALASALHLAISTLVIYVSVSVRDLDRHARVVYAALDGGNVDEARRRVSMIVSRDTASLDEEGITRAAVESVAENSGDAIAGPIVFAALFGPLGAVVFRSINTMDAMFGYKNDRYLVFGRWAARTDDAANFLPSRLTALCVCLVGGAVRRVRDSWRVVLRDARKHESPNAGFPETATAAVLGIALGGPGVYFGRLKEKAWLGDATRPIEPDDIRRAIRLMWAATGLLTVLGVAVRYLLLGVTS